MKFDAIEAKATSEEKRKEREAREAVGCPCLLVQLAPAPRSLFFMSAGCCVYRSRSKPARCWTR